MDHIVCDTHQLVNPEQAVGLLFHTKQQQQQQQDVSKWQPSRRSCQESDLGHLVLGQLALEHANGLLRDDFVLDASPF